jgi:predicted TIM-barrel enzyme
LADAIIVSGELTGSETKAEDVEVVRANTSLPLLIGSGATPENIHKIFGKADGFIVGSYFKKESKGNNFVEEQRVRGFVNRLKELRR